MENASPVDPQCRASVADHLAQFAMRGAATAELAGHASGKGAPSRSAA